MEEYLPIGTVVTLVGGEKKIMIYGRKQIQSGTNKKWDYVACLYPEGNISEKYTVFFNKTEIEKVYFVGYVDEEEIVTRELLKKL